MRKLHHPDVRFGSLADITARPRHVCFTPESRHSSVRVGCPKSAKSGHRCATSARLRSATPQEKMVFPAGISLETGNVTRWRIRLDSRSRSGRFSLSPVPWGRMDVGPFIGTIGLTAVIARTGIIAEYF